MKRPSNFLLLGLSILLILSAVSGTNNTQAGASNPFTTELLSDHSVTAEFTPFLYIEYGILTSGDTAHVYWLEGSSGSESTNIFYRQVPGGSTTRLSNLTLSEGEVQTGSMDSLISPDGTPHIIWTEETDSTEKVDLFYWSKSSGTLLLSDHSQTEGHAQSGAFPFLLDRSGTPHLVWHEETDSNEGRDIFYWTPSTGTILLTDHSASEGSIISQNMKLVLDDNDTPHITWQENGGPNVYFYWNPSLFAPVSFPDFYSNITFTVVENVAHFVWRAEAEVEGPLVYWNSATQVEQILPTSSGTPNSLKLFPDSSNDIHIVWSQRDTNACLSHWDSVTKTTQVLVLGENCEYSVGSYVDNLDTIHSLIIDEPTGSSDGRLRYWNSTLTNPILIPTNLTSVPDLIGTNDGVVHATWSESPNVLDSNFYHWDNISQAATNLSQLAGDNSRLGPREQPMLNSADELHLLWTEDVNGLGVDEYFYWNSVDKTIHNLFTDLGISSLPAWQLEDLIMSHSGDGSPYFYWYGIPTTGPEGFYFWDSSQDEVQLLDEGVPCKGIYHVISQDHDIFGNVYLAWIDQVSFTNHFWSESSGKIDFNLTAASDGCDPPIVKVSETGDIFTVWIEESDVAGEGLDLYAGWLESSIENVYLPLTVR